MVGQKSLVKFLGELCDSNSLPRFIILVGERGSESNLIAPALSGRMGIDCIVLSDVKVDTIRNMTSQAYSVKSPVMFSIQDADNMSPNARGAILKVVEEPPNKAYFIMTVTDIEGVLDTIKSRAQIYFLEPYSKEELSKYYHSNYHKEDEEIISFANTPGEIDILESQPDFFKYVKYVADNIFDVSGAESFSLLNKVSVKDDDGKYDLSLFLRAFQRECIHRKIYHAVSCTAHFKSELRIKGINRQMLLDDWCLSVRRAVKNGDR